MYQTIIQNFNTQINKLPGNINCLEMYERPNAEVIHLLYYYFHNYTYCLLKECLNDFVYV